MKKNNMTYILMLAFLMAPDIVGAQSVVYVARGHVLYQEEPPDKRRLILEPGTTLQMLGEVDTALGKMHRVRTPTGISGLMRKLDVEEVDDSSPTLGFVKMGFNHKGIHVSSGEVHPLKIKNFPTETTYEISKGIARYNIRDQAYLVNSIMIELSVDEMSRNVNIVDFNRLKTKKFPVWVQLSDGTRPAVQTWGCGKSSTVINFLQAKASASASAEASFWTWFETKLSGSIDTGSESTWTIKQADAEFQHRMTFWNLMDGEGDDAKVLLQTAIDKTRQCDATEAGVWDYVFSFPNQETEEITLTHTWAEKNGFEKSPTVPLILGNLNDLNTLKNAMSRSGFLKFEGDAPSYGAHIRDLIIKIAAAVIRPI